MSSLLPDTPAGVVTFALTTLAALLGSMHVAVAIRRLLMIAQDLAKLETRFWSGEPGLDVRQLSRSDGIAAGVLAAAIKEVDRPTGGPAALHTRISAAARVAVDRALLPFASTPAALWCAVRLRRWDYLCATRRRNVRTEFEPSGRGGRWIAGWC